MFFFKKNQQIICCLKMYAYLCNAKTIIIESQRALRWLLTGAFFYVRM